MNRSHVVRSSTLKDGNVQLEANGNRAPKPNTLLLISWHFQRHARGKCFRLQTVRGSFATHSAWEIMVIGTINPDDVTVMCFYNTKRKFTGDKGYHTGDVNIIL